MEIPAWLTQKLKTQYPGDYTRILEGYSAKRQVTLRVNTLKTERAHVEEALAAAGISFLPCAWFQDAFIVRGATEIELSRLPIYENGEIYLQSLSSMLPPLMLGAKAGESVLDMTAAPGGKTTEISALTGGTAFITACEKDKIRAERLRYNLLKQSAPRVTVLVEDALKLNEFFSFDRILLDAPCSGSGTLTEGEPLKISEFLVRNSAKLQEQLLVKALRLLKKGGTLVYSTCSLLKEENEEVVERGLKKAGGALQELAVPEGVPILPSLKGTLSVCPDERFEGFFVAKIVK